MEKKKMKLWKIVLLLIAIILLIFIITTARKMMIISSLNNKISEYENSKNMYSKRVGNSEEVKNTTVEIYVKDDVIKELVEIELENGTIRKLIQVTYPEERKLYIDTGTDKVMGIYKEDNVNPLHSTAVTNLVEFYTLSEKIFNSVMSTIKTIEINGKKCYEISSKYNSNFLYGEGTENIIIYIEKDTGLPIKIVETVNKDGNKNEYITTYEYKFDSVTEEDMLEPDITGYRMMEE